MDNGDLVKLKDISYDPLEDQYIVDSYSKPDTKYRLTPHRIFLTWDCECLDFVHRARECKHIQRMRVVDELARRNLIRVKRVNERDKR